MGRVLRGGKRFDELVNHFGIDPVDFLLVAAIGTSEMDDCIALASKRRQPEWIREFVTGAGQDTDILLGRQTSNQVTADESARAGDANRE